MKSKILIIFSSLIIHQYVYANPDLIFKNSMEYTMTSLNDTGITWLGGYPTGSCPSSTTTLPQDCHVGRDFTHNDDDDGHAGFSFTKLDASGTPLTDQGVDYATTPWACVQDNITGLVWEVKTITAGIHNKDNTYKWGGLTAIGRDHPNREGVYYEPSWNELVEGSNANALCGFVNWHVPTASELSSIVNLSTFDPSIDASYFPNTKSTWFWSSSPIAGMLSAARTAFFYSGHVVSAVRDSNIRVRLVRSR